MIFLGGGAGALLRAGLSGWISARAGDAFPWGTFTVNLIGCLAIGAVLEWLALRGAIQPETRALLVTGFLGGFTTFSTFGHETLGLLSRGESLAAAASIVGSVGLGVLAVLLGATAVRSFA